MPFSTQCGANSHSLPMVQKYCQLATRAYDQSNIPENIACLESLEHITEQDHQLLEDTNNKLTKILV